MKPHRHNPGADARAPGQAADWRARFEHSPTLFLAAALGGGLLMGIASNDRKPRTPPRRQREPQRPPKRRALSWDWNDSVGVVKSVLIGIAITQAKKVLFSPAPPQGTGAADTAPDSARH
jgi:hypothetical protein